MRLASANTYDRTIANLQSRQSELATLQDQLSAGKRVAKPSDDPISAAKAERSLSRITQLQAQQRALGVQRDSISTAESALGSAGALLQRFRELAVSAGNATNNAADRTSIASEMQSIRDQVFDLANTKDSNGVYLFSGLESAQVQGVTTPAFTTTGAPPNLQYQFNGTPGQNAPTQNAVPFTQDGDSIWMQVPKGNGAYDVTLGAANTGQLATDVGQFTASPPGSVLSGPYQVSFTVTTVGSNSTTTYSVDTVPASGVVAAGTYVDGQAIQFPDGTNTVSVMVQGTPNTGDAVQVAPYTVANPANTSLFALMDTAINGIKGNASNSPTLRQTVTQALTQIDNGSNKLLAARGQAGIWLNRADSISDANDAQSTQLESDRANAQDIDPVAGFSEFQTKQTGYQVAMQSYAQVQRLSLFDYIK